MRILHNRAPPSIPFSLCSFVLFYVLHVPAYLPSSSLCLAFLRNSCASIYSDDILCNCVFFWCLIYLFKLCMRISVRVAALHLLNYLVRDLIVCAVCLGIWFGFFRHDYIGAVDRILPASSTAVQQAQPCGSAEWQGVRTVGASTIEVSKFATNRFHKWSCTPISFCTFDSELTGSTSILFDWWTADLTVQILLILKWQKQFVFQQLKEEPKLAIIWYSDCRGTVALFEREPRGTDIWQEDQNTQNFWAVTLNSRVGVNSSRPFASDNLSYHRQLLAIQTLC